MALMQMHPEGRRRIVFHRHFAASPERVFSRFTEAHWLRRWLGGREGPLALAEFEARPGGGLRFRWPGTEAAPEIVGKVVEIDPPRLIRHRESPAPDGTAGPVDVETRFRPEGDGTLMEMSMTYLSQAVRDRVLDLPVAEAMELRFDRLDKMLA